MRTRPGWVEPEIWFRIVHLAQEPQSCAPVALYREQMVEIALGPKGAFENGNAGLRLRAPPSQVAGLAPSGTPVKEPKTPRIVELLRKADEWKALLKSGQIATQADIACQEGITRARVSQVMGLLRLAPEIREKILSLPETIYRPSMSERMLRPIATSKNTGQQNHFHLLSARGMSSI